MDMEPKLHFEKEPEKEIDVQRCESSTSETGKNIQEEEISETEQLNDNEKRENEIEAGHKEQTKESEKPRVRFTIDDREHDSTLLNSKVKREQEQQEQEQQEQEKGEGEEQEDNLEKLSPEETLIIFEWNDTVFPTTALCKSSLMTLLEDNDEKTVSKLVDSIQMMERCIFTLMNNSLSCGKVLILSTAEREWIKSSGYLFIEWAYEYMEDLDITILSARDMYSENEDDKEFTLWNRKTIEWFIEKEFSGDDQKLKNIVTFSVREFGHNAVEYIANSMKDECFTKQFWCEEHCSPHKHSMQLLEINRILSKDCLKAKNIKYKF